MRSLFWKIFLWFLAAQLLIGAAFYVLTLATQRGFDERLRGEVGDNLEARARAAAIIYEYGGAPALREVWRLRRNNRRRNRLDGAPLNDESRDARIARRDGIVRRSPEMRAAATLYQAGASEPLIGAPLPPEARAILADATRDGEATARLGDGGAWLARRFITPSGKSYVAVSRTRPPPGALVALDWRGDLGNALTKFFIVALTLGAFCFLLARSLTGPILMLQRATRQLAAGKLSTRVGAQMGTRRDELADLGHDFDVMAGHIESLMTAQSRLLADISHELRSPLTRLQLTLDLAESDAESAAGESEKGDRESAGDARRDNEKSRDYLARMRREAERLNALIGQLLTLTRLEGDAAQARREPLDLAALVEEIAADADFEARGRNRRVRVIGSEKCFVSGDAELLRRAIENVVRNAVHHAPENSEIEIALHRARAGENGAASTRERAAMPSRRRNQAARELSASTAPVPNAPDANTRNNAAILPAKSSAAPATTLSKKPASTRGEKTRDFAVLRVRDFGGGVPDESLPRLFDPFYRVATARDRNSGGVGLGLSITARAVRLHGGTVEARNADGGGLLVEIRLPAAAQEDTRAAI